MKLRDMEIVEPSKLRVLGKYANMEALQFLEEMELLRSKGRIPDYYQSLCNRIKAYYQQQPPAPHAVGQLTEDVLRQLSEVPVSELQKYMPILYNAVASGLYRVNVTSVGEFCQLKMFAGRMWGIGEKRESDARKLQAYVSEHYDQILFNWRERHYNRTLPDQYDPKKGLFVNFHEALCQLGVLLKRRVNSPHYPRTIRYSSEDSKTYPVSLMAKILIGYYLEGKSQEELADEIGVSVERIREPRVSSVRAFLSGAVICENLSIDSRLKDECQWIKEHGLFLTEDELSQQAGHGTVSLLHDLDLDYLEVLSQQVVIPKDKKGVYSKVRDAFLETFRNYVAPVQPEDLLHEVMGHRKLEGVNEPLAADFVRSLMRNESICMCQADGAIQLLDEHYCTNQQRMARLVYDAQHPVTDDEAKRMFADKYGYRPSLSLSALKRYGINSQGILWYYGVGRKPIQTFVTEYAQEHKIFYYSELRDALLAQNYTILSSTRAYITNVCQVDNQNRQHFCHKDYVHLHPEFSWRIQSRDGLRNWILNHIRELLEEQGEMEYDDVINAVMDKALGTSYEAHIKERCKVVLKLYSTETPVFTIENGIVRPNRPYYDSVDFNTIGMRIRRRQ